MMVFSGTESNENSEQRTLKLSMESNNTLAIFTLFIFFFSKSNERKREFECPLCHQYVKTYLTDVIHISGHIEF